MKRHWLIFTLVLVASIGLLWLGFYAERLLSQQQCADALLAAVKAGDVAEAETLLAHGASVEARYHLNWWDYGDPEADWRNEDRTPLAIAICRGDSAMIKMLVSHRANVNAKTGQEGAIPPYDIILSEAASTCDVSIIRLLLAKGARVDARGGMGVTPLMMAARDNRVETVKLLLQKGADVNAHDERGFVPLSFARAKSRADHRQVIRLLKDAGARS